MEALLAGLIAIPVVLLALLLLRVQQRTAARRADLATFAGSRGLKGSIDQLLLQGEIDGAACYVSADAVGAGQQRWLMLRARVLVTPAAGYRAVGAPAALALAIARNRAVPTERVTGLRETTTGDAGFDAAFRTFVAPDADAPWSDPGLRSAMTAVGDRLALAERGPTESSVSFAKYERRGADVGRAMVLASSLASAERARRHAAELATPRGRTPIEERRVYWCGLRFAVVSIVGLLAIGPVLLSLPALGIHGSPARDVTVLLAAMGAAFALVLALFSICELAIRSRARG